MRCLIPILGVLPNLLDYNGDWLTLSKAAYAVFRQDFFRDGVFDGQLRVFVNGTRDSQGIEEGFKHITTREHAAGRRHPDVDRTRRINWIRPIITHCSDDLPGLLYWRYLEGGGEVRRYYWARDDSFLVICSEGRKVCDRLFLASAFAVTNFPKRRDLERKYQRRLQVGSCSV